MEIKCKHTEILCIYDDRDIGFSARIYDIRPTQRAERNGINVIIGEEGDDKNMIDNKKDDNVYRIRKLTPLECWRLMGFSDDDFDKAQQAGISDTQLYKQAGNSIVVDVLYYIFKNLYEAMPYLFDDLKVGSYFSGIGAFEKGLDRLYEDINSGNLTKPQVI